MINLFIIKFMVLCPSGWFSYNEWVTNDFLISYYLETSQSYNYTNYVTNEWIKCQVRDVKIQEIEKDRCLFSDKS